MAAAVVTIFCSLVLLFRFGQAESLNFGQCVDDLMKDLNKTTGDNSCLAFNKYIACCVREVLTSDPQSRMDLSSLSTPKTAIEAELFNLAIMCDLDWDAIYNQVRASTGTEKRTTTANPNVQTLATTTKGNGGGHNPGTPNIGHCVNDMANDDPKNLCPAFNKYVICLIREMSISNPPTVIDKSAVSMLNTEWKTELSKLNMTCSVVTKPISDQLRISSSVAKGVVSFFQGNRASSQQQIYHVMAMIASLLFAGMIYCLY